jgi:hypothetical protein
MSDQQHPDPLEDPQGYAAYQAEHEDDEAVREANARAAAEKQNDVAPAEPPSLLPDEAHLEPPDELWERLNAEDRARASDQR